MMLGYPPKPERQVRGMSALPPKADIGTKPRNVHFVPIAESAAMTPPNYSGSSTNRETGSGPYGRGTANKMWMSRKFGFESAAVPARLEVQSLIREVGLIEDDFEDEAAANDLVTDKEDLSEETNERAVTLVPNLPTGS